ncbi:hypothetical protein DA469_21630 [Bacillus subtilis]|nr:hypothetical protein DA469_21630 [Bacillus subtilis]
MEKNKIIYLKEQKLWRVSFYNKEKKSNSLAHYSEVLYGDYSERIAMKTLKEGKRAYNFIEILDDHALLVTFSKTYGIVKSQIDIEDIDKINKHVWRAIWSKRNNSFYISSNSGGKLHRYLMDIKDNNNVIESYR